MATPLTLNIVTSANTGQLYVLPRPAGYVKATCVSTTASDVIWVKLMNSNAGDSLAFNSGALSPVGTLGTPGTYAPLQPGQSIELDYLVGKNAYVSPDYTQNKFTHLAVWSATGTAVLNVVAN